jgi:hypothetical protein
MSMKIVRLGSFLFAFVLAASAFCVDFTVLAGNSTSQNTNSSTTTAQNSNTGKTTSGRRRRQKRAAATTTAETSTSAAESTSMAATEQTDLSGTYTGTFDCSDAGESGETTLTITGNQFTLTDGKSGRIVASTTSGYTGVAMQFGELATTPTAQPASPPLIVSMRAKKSGNRLTLTTVPGSTHVCSFTPSGGARSRNRKAKPAAPATAAEPATPAEPTMATPPASAGPEPPATPAPRRRGRRGSRGNTNTNSNMNMNNNTGTGNENMTATPTPPPAIRRN